jgi:NAD(P)-dependent dehydrogenase (short-subunit alcohol dehydrogenase family)
MAQRRPLSEVKPSDSIFPETLGEAKSSQRLLGRKILVVGAGQRNTVDENVPIGNGRAMSILFAREGASVVCLDSNQVAADATVDQIKREGGKAVPLVFDVRNADGIAAAVDNAKTMLGGQLDGLALVVGISKGLALSKLTKEAWDDDFAVNVRSHMLFSQRAIEVMSPGGSIVVLSSMASQRAAGGNPAYECSKAAQLALVRAVARAGETKGIRANAIAPGYVDTPMGRDASRRSSNRAQVVPFGRQATGWEVGYSALFLMSHEASYINATTIFMDGGGTSGLVGRKREERTINSGAKL